MSRHLLRLKHWQLFAMFFVLPLIIFLIRFSKTIIHGNIVNIITDPKSIVQFVLVISIISIIVLGICYSWFWAVGIGFKRKIPKGIFFNYNLFRATVLFPVVYLIGLPLMISFFSTEFCEFHTCDSEQTESSFKLLLPLHFFSLFCSLYCIYFTAKTIKTIELQREPTFKEYYKDMILILLFFIGVWYIQPRINEIRNKKDLF